MNIVSRIVRKVTRELSQRTRLKKLAAQGFQTAPPNYVFLPPKVATPAVIDIGCGYEAEFAVGWITERGAKALIVDPTRKHRPFLEAIVEKHAPSLQHLPYAVSAADGECTFYESVDNESGSLQGDHVNVDGAETTSYQVTQRTIAGLIAEAGFDEIEMIKVDIEGAEFELFEGFDFDAVRNARQMFVEFHHNQISSRSADDTLAIVARFEEHGFTANTADQVNYLFVNQRLA